MALSLLAQPPAAGTERTYVRNMQLLLPLRRAATGADELAGWPDGRALPNTRARGSRARACERPRARTITRDSHRPAFVVGNNPRKSIEKPQNLLCLERQLEEY